MRNARTDFLKSDRSAKARLFAIEKPFFAGGMRDAFARRGIAGGTGVLNVSL